MILNGPYVFVQEACTSCSKSTCLFVKLFRKIDFFKMMASLIASKKVNPEKSRTISKKSRDKIMKIPGSRDFEKIPSHLVPE